MDTKGGDTMNKSVDWASACIMAGTVIIIGIGVVWFLNMLITRFLGPGW